LVDEARGKPGLEDAFLAGQANTEGFHGRLAKASEFSRQAVESALRAGAKEIAATWQADSALRDAEFGNFVKAQREAVAALKLAKTKEVQTAAAMALARVGEIGQSQTIVASLERSFGEDTLLNSYWLPSIRAAIALHQKRADRALEDLQTATLYELGGGIPPFNGGATMYPVYLRGEAYLANRQWDLGAAEFQKILDHRSLVWNFPLGVLARLQLARAYAGSGHKTQARSAYQELLRLWHDADTGSPTYRAATNELARLR
jgi:eukaryotic-like serine/threonine-protein kinase